MADTEESPAQRQARIRRQKREAKISGTATERLDKITRLSGRAPESMRNESPVSTPPASSPTPQPQQFPPQTWNASQNASQNPTQDQARAQEELLAAMLRQPPPQEGQDQTSQEDPMMKMLQAMMGGMNGNPDLNVPGEMGGIPSLSPDDIAKATGLPPFVTNMFMGNQKAPPSQAEARTTQLWKILHVVFAIVASMYLIFTVNASTHKYGDNPPAPATFQNPFLVSLTGELLLQTGRMFSRSQSGKSGIGLWVQVGKELFGDGMIMVFGLGLAHWLNG